MEPIHEQIMAELKVMYLTMTTANGYTLDVPAIHRNEDVFGPEQAPAATLNEDTITYDADDEFYGKDVPTARIIAALAVPLPTGQDGNTWPNRVGGDLKKLFSNPSTTLKGLVERIRVTDLTVAHGKVTGDIVGAEIGIDVQYMHSSTDPFTQ